MKIKKNISKGIVMLALFLAQSLMASAGAEISLEGISTIALGETKTVSIVLTNDEVATAMQADLYLPKGMEYVEGTLTLLTDRVKGRAASVQESYEPEGTWNRAHLRIVETDGTIAAGEGAIITFDVTRTSNMKEGNNDIVVDEIVISNPNGDKLNSKNIVTVNVLALGLTDCTLDAVTKSYDMEVSNEYQMDITLTNEGINNLNGLQGTLALPEGLEIVPGEYGNFIYTDRIPGKMEFKFKEVDGALNFVLSTTSNQLISGNEGVLFSVKVKVKPELAENAQILFSNLRVADNTGRSVASDNIVITVTNTDVALLAKLKNENLKVVRDELDASIAAAEEVKDEQGVASAITNAEQAYDDLEDAIDAAYEAGTLGEFDFDKESEPAFDAIDAIDAAVKAAKKETVVGDIDGNGKVDGNDLILFLSDLNNATLPKEGDAKFKVYDANNDGKLTIADAQAIQNLSVGLNWDGSIPE